MWLLWHQHLAPCSSTWEGSSRGPDAWALPPPVFLWRVSQAGISQLHFYHEITTANTWTENSEKCYPLSQKEFHVFHYYTWTTKNCAQLLLLDFKLKKKKQRIQICGRCFVYCYINNYLIPSLPPGRKSLNSLLGVVYTKSATCYLKSWGAS